MTTTLQGKRIAILVAAGADAVGGEVAIEGNLISSRSPGDLPAFCRATVEQSVMPQGRRS